MRELVNVIKSVDAPGATILMYTVRSPVAFVIVAT